MCKRSHTPVPSQTIAIREPPANPAMLLGPGP